MYIRLGGQRELAETVVQPSWIRALVGSAITGKSQIAVDDVVSANLGRSIRIVCFHVFETGL